MSPGSNNATSGNCGPRIRRWQWAALIAAAVGVRLALFAVWGDREPTIVDAQDYDRLAATLVETGLYATPSGEPSSLRPPLYPSLVAGVYRFFGIHNHRAVSIAQSLLSLATVWLTYRLAVEVYDPSVGFTAAAITAFYPSLLAFNLLTLSEVLFTFFFVGVVLSSIRLLKAPAWADALALGLCLGLGSLTRSILWLCAVPAAVYIVLFATYSTPRRLAVSALAVIVFSAVLAPWAWRNTRVQQTFTLVDVMGGRNVMMGNYEHTPLERSWATVSDVKGDRAWHVVLAKATPGYSQLTQGQIDKKAMAYGIRYFFSHPTQSAKRVAVRFFNFWQLERTIVAGVRQGIFGEFSKGATIVAAALFCGCYAVVALAAIWGAIVTPPAWRVHLMLLCWIGVPCLIHTAAFAHSRYHLPMTPILAVYAASALLGFRSRQRISTPRCVFAAAVSLLLIAGWLRELVMVDMALLG